MQVENSTSRLATATIVLDVVYIGSESQIAEIRADDDALLASQLLRTRNDFSGRNADLVLVRPQFQNVTGFESRIDFTVDSVTNVVVSDDSPIRGLGEARKVLIEETGKDARLDRVTVFVAQSFTSGLGLAYLPTPASFRLPPMCMVSMDAWGDYSDERVLARPPFRFYALGRTLTHELAHVLGLVHTFTNGCLAIGDAIADTPPTPIPFQDFENPAQAARSGNCAGGAIMFENFMDYATDAQAIAFTRDQVLAMHDTLLSASNARAAARDVTVFATPQPLTKPVVVAEEEEQRQRRISTIYAMAFAAVRSSDDCKKPRCAPDACLAPEQQ